MNKKLRQLVERRERLVTQISAQRVALVQNIEPWRMPLVLADQGVRVLRSIGRHPEWIAGVVFLTVALRPGRVLKWLGRGWVTWQVLYKLRDR